ncbi:MAG: NAD(P)/FAD-dependent oxidoreductase [Myxococcota bacterium]|nr:NAD(P)/FAD-dependent oxidoreductase [Myxococcota bacterium]
MTTSPRVLILGAGISGLCMGIRLKQSGIDSFTILEKSDRVGGTWRDNTYPGVACDVPSHLYSYSFELNPDWSRIFSPGWEIQEYCEHCADKYGLAPHLRFGAEIEHIEYTDEDWCVRLEGGEEFHADFVVSALGGLHKPKVASIPGADDFEGTSFHSAQWRPDRDLAGCRVAIIGSAASAIQIVPEIAEQTEHLTIFQRTPNWILPRGDRAYPAWLKRAFRIVPGLQRLYRLFLYLLLEARFPVFVAGSRLAAPLERLCRRSIAMRVPDPELRARLTPDYKPGCKRMLISDDYFETLLRNDVDLVTTEIKRLEPSGVRTADGRLHEADTLIYATGFEAFNFLAPLRVTGRSGVQLAEQWAGGIEAHRTVAVPGFPNFFMLLGPNSGLGHNSVIIMIEAQVGYILKCIRAASERALVHLDPRREESDRFNRDIQQDLDRTIWKSGCKSWYMDENGKVFALWPSSTLRYLWEMRRPLLHEYEQLTPAPSARTARDSHA